MFVKIIGWTLVGWFGGSALLALALIWLYQKEFGP